jgi:hypothetical protein
VTASTSVYFVANFRTVATKETSAKFYKLGCFGGKKEAKVTIFGGKKVTCSHLDK